MSKVDFMLGVVTSLIATILFELRFILIVNPARYLAASVQKLCMISSPFLKVRVFTIVLASVFLAGMFRLSTETVLAPSNHSHSENTQVAANGEELIRLRKELDRLNYEVQESRGMGPEYHRKVKNIYVLMESAGVR